MKKKYLWWLCALPIVASPALLALSHLSPLYTSVKEITTTTTTTPYENLKEAKPCLNTLLYGDKHYNGGNYVVIIGTDNQSINSENLNTFIFGTNDESKRSDKIVPQDAPVIQASQKIEEYFKGFNYSNSGAFAVDTYIEADRVSDADYGRDDNMQNPTIKEGEFLTPFDKFTKGDYLKNDSNKKYKEGKYIREDEDAKQYRKLAKTLTKLFPEVDLSNSKSVALQWVFGYPVASALSISGCDEFLTTVTGNFKTGFESGLQNK